MKFFLFSLSVFLFSIPIASAEVIRSFDVDIQILDADTMTVTETIVYDFEDEWRHGIFRNIPEDIEFTSVLNELGNPLTYRVTNTYTGQEAKIGDPYKTTTGENTYLITYQAKDPLYFFRDHDELYWNVNGNGWGIPIQSSSATVTFPYTFDSNDPQLRATCYTGYYGENDSNCTTTIKATTNQTTFLFQTTQPLTTNYHTNQNMTIVAGIPRTFLEKKPQHIPWAERTWGQRVKTQREQVIAYLLKEGIFLLAAITLFLLTFIIWFKKGRDPKPQNPIIAHYTPPKDLTAAEINVLINNRITAQAVPATIFELGTKGIIQIKKESHKLKFLLLRKAKKNELSEFQKFIYDKIFNKGNKKEITLSKIRHKLSTYTTYQRKIIDKLIQDGYYATRPFTYHKVVFPILGAIAIMIGLQLTTLKTELVGIGIMLFMAGFFSLIFGFSMTKKTPLGVEITQQIKGFKEFLEVTQEQRLAFHNPPAQTITLFEKMLPFATALSVEKKWVNSFKPLIENQTTHNNSWIDLSNISSTQLSKDISSIRAISASSPSSSGSSGFGGGFGGGGSSGGGGGGGGGGSW
jgi:uncharacterized membrane protein